MSDDVVLIVGHADDADLLERNVAHHLELGIDRIVVTTVGADPDAREIVARSDGSRVFHHVVDPAREDAFAYFESGTRFALEAFAPAWLGFVDSDEFVVARSGRLAAPPGAGRYDVVGLRRFNAALLRDAADTPLPVALDDLATVPLVDAETEIERAWLAGDRRVPYIAGRDVAPKVFVRPEVLARVVLGGHAIESDVTYVARALASDLAIVHVPFTTLDRFWAKVARVRAAFSTHAARFHDDEAWHWRHWATLDEAGVEREFASQTFASGTGGDGTLTDARALFARWGDAPPALDAGLWPALQRLVSYTEFERARARGVAFLELVFDERSYFARYYDLRVSANVHPDFNAAAHFVHHGLREGRSPSIAFDAPTIRAAVESRLGTRVDYRDAWWAYFDIPEAERPIPNRWFDAAAFRRLHDDGSRAPFAHDWDAFTAYLAASRAARAATAPAAT